MSIHYLVRIRPEYVGPRYNDIKDITFEIQVRTVAMHAWAAISHALDYKRKADVPQSLRKSLNALSALFYVADAQFETFAQQIEESQRNATVAVSEPNNVEQLELDLDTLSALLAREYPTRNKSSASEVSGLLEELQLAGITGVSQLLEMLQKYPDTPHLFDEAEMMRNDRELATVGACRILLSVHWDSYLKVRREGSSPVIERFRKNHNITPDDQ